MRTESEFTSFIQRTLLRRGIQARLEGTTNIEIAAALQNASKSLTGKPGYPDIVAVVKDFVLIMENKSDYAKLELKDGTKYVSTLDALKNYAVNGAIFYGRKVFEGTNYTKIFAFGNAGDEKYHNFKPVFIGENKIKELPLVKSFENFTAENIENYYLQAVLGEESAEEKELKKIIKYAGNLHEDLRNYGQLGETEKPRVVAGIILALDDGLKLDELKGTPDETLSDGAIIFYHIVNRLNAADIQPEVKKERLLAQFQLIKNRPLLNSIHDKLDKTPLKYFAQSIQAKVYEKVKSAGKDYLGMFYREFISYSGGDGQTLGVVLTPDHITKLFCDLVDLKADDVVFDPCCGTGGFLLAAMDRMLSLAKNEEQRQNIKATQLHGVEVRDDMFSIATTSMILRGDGKSNLICDNFFAKTAEDFAPYNFTAGFMNPPYSQAKNDATKHLSELRFIEHLLECMTPGARVAVIVPVSAMIGKTKDDKILKKEILKRHTLKGVISLSKNTFYQIGTVPCIAVFEAGKPHRKNFKVKFINFEDDGFELRKHEGYLPTFRADDCRKYLLDCWNDNIADAPSSFMVETPIDAEDEWLHSFYYYNDERPTESDFLNTIADYLTFEFNMIVHGRAYLFDRVKKKPALTAELPPLENKIWKTFIVGDLFNVKIGKAVIGNQVDKISGKYAYVTRKESNNGVDGFIDYDEKFLNTDFPVITVGAETAAPFVQKYPFFTGVKVNILSSKKTVSEYVLQFVAQAIKMQQSNYNYAFALISSKMRTQKILLPVNEMGEPDFEYMEKYIALREDKLIKQYLENICPPKVAQTLPPNKKVWREFFIEDIFEKIQRGKRLKTADHIKGEIPYVSSSAQNNGVDNFIGNNGKIRKFENCLTIANSGSVGETFYHSYEFIASDHVTALISSKLNQWSYLFIAPLLKRLQEKYSFNREINDFRIRKEKLMLPVNETGAPDFEYMEAYSRKLFAQVLQKYLDVVQ